MGARASRRIATLSSHEAIKVTQVLSSILLAELDNPSVPDATELNELKKELKRNEHEGAEVALELRASRERIGILEAELVDLRASGGGTDHEARSAPNGSVAQCVLGPHDCSVPQGCEAACEVAEAQEHLSLAGSLFHGTACGCMPCALSASCSPAAARPRLLRQQVLELV